ncbi:MAG TPA: hypothetical protein VJC05_04290 [Candidatus Andersenbacteria bacterium]|nr:hypothetical protein [Candidatus Andersenbacteria bacterium]
MLQPRQKVLVALASMILVVAGLFALGKVFELVSLTSDVSTLTLQKSFEAFQERYQ